MRVGNFIFESILVGEGILFIGAEGLLIVSAHFLEGSFKGKQLC